MTIVVAASNIPINQVISNSTIVSTILIHHCVNKQVIILNIQGISPRGAELFSLEPRNLERWDVDHLLHHLFTIFYHVYASKDHGGELESWSPKNSQAGERVEREPMLVRSVIPN